MTLESRLKLLEKSAAPDLGIRMIVRKVIDVDRLDAEGVRCVHDDREWRRANDESEDQFTDRVDSQISENPRERIPSVVMYCD